MFSFLAGLPAAEIERLQRESELMELPAGARVIEEGSQDDRLFLIVSGELSVTQDGQRRAALAAGDLAGEIAAAADSHSFNRTATVTAHTAATLIAVPADLVRHLERADRGVRDHLRSLRARRLSFDALARHLRPE
jgi:CRP-like cAMP-binding protein